MRAKRHHPSPAPPPATNPRFRRKIRTFNGISGFRILSEYSENIRNIPELRLWSVSELGFQMTTSTSGCTARPDCLAKLIAFSLPTMYTRYSCSWYHLHSLSRVEGRGTGEESGERGSGDRGETGGGGAITPPASRYSEIEVTEKAYI